MKIHEILGAKGHDVATITGDRSVLDAAKRLAEEDIGSLVVMAGDSPVGIITERDILRVAALRPSALGSTRVGEAMTLEPILAEPDAELEEMMQLMTERRVRHLPVVAGERLVGLVSIGDLLKACLETAKVENVQLRQYIHGSW